MPTTNTISADLKRTAILQVAIRAFTKKLLPLRSFSTSFFAKLDGTDEVSIPYFPLQTDPSTDFNAANGYVFAGNTNSDAKKITVNKRKYIAVDYSSEEFARQPQLNAEQLAIRNAEKLAEDVMFDILSVITLANFGLAGLTISSAAFTSNEVADLREAANNAHWPSVRSLIVNSDMDGALCKDTDVKLAMNIGTTDVIREGKIPKLLGFDYHTMAAFPENGEKLAGIIVAPSAVAVAFAPVTPAPGVRSQLAIYETVTDNETGLTFDYRRWGNPQMDRDMEVIECAYGFSVVEAAALKRICNP